jgi:hypothetical protein
MKKSFCNAIMILLIIATIPTNADDVALTPGEVVGCVVFGARDTIVQKIAAIRGEKAGAYYAVLTDASTFVAAAKKKPEVWSAGDSIVLGLTQALSDPTRRIDERLTRLFPSDIQSNPLSQLGKWTRVAIHNSPMLVLKSLCVTFLSGNQASFNTTVREGLPIVGNGSRSHHAGIKAIRQVNFFMITRVVFVVGLMVVFVLMWHMGKLIYRMGSIVFFLALFPQTFRTVIHVIISGTPPITLFHNPVVFVAWFGIFLGIILELVEKDGIRILIATTIGVVFVCIAGMLGDRDTINAVTIGLTKFYWFAKHIMSPTIAYTALGLSIVSGLAFLMGIGLPPDSRRIASARLWFDTTFSFCRIFTLMGVVVSGLWTAQPWTH